MMAEWLWTVNQHGTVTMLEWLYGNQINKVQSNLDYPNPFGKGEIWNRSDKQKVWITLTTPTRSIMHAKRITERFIEHFDDFNPILD